jgi:hypothetical protein
MNRIVLSFLFFGALTYLHAATPGFLFCGNISVDSIPPTITCPPNVTLTLGATTCDTVYEYTVTVEDDQPGVTYGLVTGLQPGDTFPVGATVNLFLAIDAGGNTASCSFSVQVVGGQGPSLFCKATLTVELDDDCKVSVSPEEMLIPPYGCPGIYLVEVDKTMPFGNGPWSPANLTVTDLGKTYQARVTDSKNGNKCWGNIKIVDSLPPALDCPVINVPCALPSDHLTPVFLKDSLGITTGMPTAMDNCSGSPFIVLSFVDTTANLPCDSPGTITGYIHRFWTARDESGNSATCIQVINRQRKLADILFPPDVTVSCADPDIVPDSAGVPYIQVWTRQYGVLAAPLCEIDVFYFDTLETLCGGSRRIHRVWSAQDACLPVSTNNPLLHTQTIDVLDTDIPLLQCPANTVLVLMTDSCTVTMNFPDVIVGDNCSPLSEITAFWAVDSTTKNLVGTLEDFTGNSPAAFDTLAVFPEVTDFPVGITTLLYVATDVCGNIGSCETVLNVWDTTPPTAVCDSVLTVYLDSEGAFVLTADAADAGSADDCGDLSFKVRRTEAGACSLTDLSFDDLQPFCCADAGDTVSVVVRVYDVYVEPGIVSDSFATGHFGDCMVRVAVRDTIALTCTPPENVTVECSAFDPSSAAYGEITYSCKVDSVAFGVDYAAFDSVCTKGMITRLFRVFDEAGNSGQCSQQIGVLPGTQDYWIKFPDDRIVTTCDGSNNFGEPQIGNPGCENMKVIFQDEIFTVVPDACYKIERTWTIYNTCTYDSAAALITIPNPNPNVAANHPTNLPGPVVSPAGTPAPWAPTLVAISPGQTPTNYSTFWSADANGYKYKQIIKVLGWEDPVYDLCPAPLVDVADPTNNDPDLWNAAQWWNASTQSHDLDEAPTNLCVTVSDLCSGAEVTIRYVLYLDLNNDGMQETAIASNNLPGPNTVNVGNASNPNFSGGTPRTFDERAVPADQKYGFALETIKNGNSKMACVRWNTQQSPLLYTIPQLPHGTHRIKWYTTDRCGNEKTCEYSFVVSYEAEELTLNGLIETEAGSGVAQTTVAISGGHPSFPPFTGSVQTNTDGEFQFKVKELSSYTVTPKRNDDPLNGVSTFDLVLINKHVLGIEPLSSPYRIIAADANRSKTVTTFDIVELRKLILGIYNALPAGDSWRFVDKNYTFSDEKDPFKDNFPETQSVSSLTADSLPFHEFVGLKVGDANGNAVANVFDVITDKRSARSLYFDLEDRRVQSGDIFDLRLTAAAPVAGCQFTFNYPGFEVLELQPGPGMAADNFAVFNESETLAASWESPGAPAAPAFTLRFRAKTDGQLSELLRLSHRIARPEAYDADLELLDLALRFNGSTVQRAGFELFQNRPNPFSTHTTIGFYLPEAQKATLRVIDATGRERYTHTAFYAAGLHTVVLGKDMLGDGGGVLYARLETATEQAVQRMVFMP